MNALVPYLVGAASTLVVQVVIQFWVVPRVEKRKRREDRWERDVRELGELLAMRLTDLANDTHAAQWLYRQERDKKSDEYDPALVARLAREGQQATFTYGSLIGAQVDWLADRVLSINRKAPDITRFQRAAQDYRMRAIFVRVPPEDDDRTDTAFDDAWEKERAARQALISQAKLLADLPHPPRVPLRAAVAGPEATTPVQELPEGGRGAHP